MPPRVWQAHEAKARFGKMLEACALKGPQIVAKRGVKAAVLVPVDEWRRMKRMARRNLKELLLATEARTDELTPRRGRDRHREASPLE